MNDNKQTKLRKIQLKIVLEIKRICEKNNINYFLDSGSMLGAVRHKGFIPWDDDIDIGMLKKDYDKFLKIAPKELNKKYFIDNYELNKNYGLVFSKVKMKNTSYIEKIGAPKQEIFVDIFPYFYRPNNCFKRKLQSIKLRILSQVFMAQSGYHVWDNKKGIFKLKFVPIRVIAKIINKEKIYKKIDHVYNSCKKSDLIGEHDGVSYNYWYFDSNYLNEFIDVEFENNIFKIPKEYDKILKTVYGDYMTIPPVEKRITHEIVELKIGNTKY